MFGKAEINNNLNAFINKYLSRYAKLRHMSVI